MSSAFLSSFRMISTMHYHAKFWQPCHKVSVTLNGLLEELVGNKNSCSLSMGSQTVFYYLPSPADLKNRFNDLKNKTKHSGKNSFLYYINLRK